MAITRIDDVHLYAAITAGADECWKIKQWLVENKIKFTTLYYGDDSQHADVLTALNTWWENPGFTDFPVLTYTEVHDDIGPSQFPRNYFKTLADIKASSFLQTYKSTNSPTA
jgi:hypothetical protein